MSKKSDSNKIKPYKPKMPYTARNPYSNRRREEEAQRIKQKMINNGTWDENDYQNAKIVVWIVMLIIAGIILYIKISDVNSRYE
ncbi:hypothetical protein OKW96_18640 [Sphingobacterium sp. KU25419]|nr:hypothetical protein OKW96_18640 [Sphingobacterium sp. KU25419]